MRAKSGSSNGACELVSRRKKALGERDMPGERHRRHMERHYGCKGRRLLALDNVSHKWYAAKRQRCLRRLKLVTGVDISTRPVRSGREGKAKKNMSLRTAADVNRMAFRRSITMTDVANDLDVKSASSLARCTPSWRPRKNYTGRAALISKNHFLQHTSYSRLRHSFLLRHLLILRYDSTAVAP